MNKRVEIYRFFLMIAVFATILSLFPATPVYCNTNISGLELNVDNNTGKLTIKANPENIATEEAAINAGLSKFRLLVIVVLAFATLTMIIVFIKNFTILGLSSTNPQTRGNAITGLVVSGVATAGLGGITIFFAFFYTLLQ